MREFQIAKIYHRDEETAEVKNRFEIRELKVDWLGTILRVGMMGKWRKWKPLKWYRDYSGGVYSTPVQFSTLEEATEFLKRLETRIHVDEIVGGTRFPSQKCKTSPHCSHNTNDRDLSKPCSISFPDPVAEGECKECYCANKSMLQDVPSEGCSCSCHTPKEECDHRDCPRSCWQQRPPIEAIEELPPIGKHSQIDFETVTDIYLALNEVIRVLNRLTRK